MMPLKLILCLAHILVSVVPIWGTKTFKNIVCHALFQIPPNQHRQWDVTMQGKTLSEPSWTLGTQAAPCLGEWVGIGKGPGRERKVQVKDSVIHKRLFNQGDHKKAKAPFSFREDLGSFPSSSSSQSVVQGLWGSLRHLQGSIRSLTSA